MSSCNDSTASEWESNLGSHWSCTFFALVCIHVLHKSSLVAKSTESSIKHIHWTQIIIERLQVKQRLRHFHSSMIMRSLNHALCLSLCIALLFSSTHASAQRDNTPVAVNISVGDSSPYTSIIAQFGDQFYGHTFEANLMLPPDDQMLCEFSPSLVNLTTAEAHNWTASRPIALLLSRGNCSFEQKARVALKMPENFTTLLKYMIVYNNNETRSVTEDVLIVEKRLSERQLFY